MLVSPIKDSTLINSANSIKITHCSLLHEFHAEQQFCQDPFIFAEQFPHGGLHVVLKTIYIFFFKETTHFVP
jgi:hypothetical protein